MFALLAQLDMKEPPVKLVALVIMNLIVALSLVLLALQLFLIALPALIVLIARTAMQLVMIYLYVLAPEDIMFLMQILTHVLSAQAPLLIVTPALQIAYAIHVQQAIQGISANYASPQGTMNQLLDHHILALSAFLDVIPAIILAPAQHVAILTVLLIALDALLVIMY